VATVVESAQRKRFVPPKLVRYGALERITMASGLGSGFFDGGGKGTTQTFGFNNDI